MVVEALSVAFGATWIYYALIGCGASKLFTRKVLSEKSKEEIRSMKSWKDTSLLKKVGYVIFPGAYFAVESEKKRIDRLETEIKNELMERYDISPQKELGLE